MSSVSLSKGGNVSLSKSVPGLSKVRVGLGWDTRKTSGDAFDLDASAFLVGEDEKVASKQDFVFFNNLKSANGSVEHTGDNLTGEGEGDDESIKVDLSSLPSTVKKVVFTVTIYDAEKRKQNFGQVSNAFIRIVDESSNQEITRYDLQEDASVDDSMIFGELYKHNDEWKFRAVGQSIKGGLQTLAQQFGV